MTGEEWRKRSCGDKRKFDTRHKARIAAQRAQGNKKFKFTYYRCKFCKHYHLARTIEAKRIAEIIENANQSV